MQNDRDWYIMGIVMVMLSRGQIEDAIAKEVTTFYADILGIGPKETRVYLTRDMAILRLQRNLRLDEKILLKNEHGVQMVKSMRTAILESVVDDLAKIIEKHTHAKVISTHADSSTRTGERFTIFVLDREVF